jgi:hypothetical protein
MSARDRVRQKTIWSFPVLPRSAIKSTPWIPDQSDLRIEMVIGRVTAVSATHEVPKPAVNKYGAITRKV